MISMDKKYRTRDGRKVELLTTNGRGGWPVVGYIKDDDRPQCWTAEGRYLPDEGNTVRDLVEVVEPTKLYLIDFSSPRSPTEFGIEDNVDEATMRAGDRPVFEITITGDKIEGRKL